MRTRVRETIVRGLSVAQKGARNYPAHRECFACHHQTLPLLGMTRAESVAIPIDAGLKSAIVDFTVNSFSDQIDNLKAGEGIGGRGLTVGYGLWTLRMAQVNPDDLTAAMVTYLLKTQDADGHWGLHAVRPPAEESRVMCTVLAAAGVRSFAADSQRGPATEALNKARSWLAAAALESHEDHVARLWGLHLLGGDTEEQLVAAREALVRSQSSDGSWSQLPEMSGDAYATATALYVLLETEPPSAARGGPDRAQERAVQWLIDHQLSDGSWHVRTRAKPVQAFFDNGDPHGADQFISMSATGWATAALARFLAREGTPPGSQDAKGDRRD